MIFHENRLLADDSHEISCLIFSKIRKDVANVCRLLQSLGALNRLKHAHVKLEPDAQT